MLEQMGPWKGQNIVTNKIWLSGELERKTELINYDEINRDIKSFTNNKNNIILDKNVIIDIINTFNNYNYDNKSKKIETGNNGNGSGRK